MEGIYVRFGFFLFPDFCSLLFFVWFCGFNYSALEVNVFLKQFNAVPYNFVSNLNAEALNAEMLAFCDKKFWDFSVNMRGNVKGIGYYWFVRRWQIGGLQGVGIMLPSLRAKVVPVDNYCTVEVVTGSLYLSLIGVAVFVFLGFCLLCSGIFGDNGFDSAIFTIGLAFMIIAPVGIAYQNYWSRMRLLNTFVDVFGLSQS